MNKWVYYFYPSSRVSYFDKLKTLFFIKLCFFGIGLLLFALPLDFWFRNDNFLLSVYSKLLEIFLFVSILFVLKKKGIYVAGNLFSVITVVIILIFMNIYPQNIDINYKYIQGFYSILLFLIIGLLFASRLVIMVNSALILITTTRVYIHSVQINPGNSNFYTMAFIYHSIVLMGITVIIFYTNKFTHLTINKANKEIEHRRIQYQELLATEEEIRAANEELVATTDALVESSNQLTIAKENAEESNRLKTQFLNNISHEVRTPLNGILGFSQLLNLPGIDKQSQEEYIDVIQKSGSQLLVIIDNIIEISKLDAGKVMVSQNCININHFLNELYSVFKLEAFDKKIGFYLSLPFSDAESNLLIDEVKLYKILSNLIENALKFTEVGSVEFGYKIVMAINSTNLSQHEICFFVKDTGIGIDLEKQEIIFEKFSQAESTLSRQYGGLGLGLSIANENAKLIEGTIALSSQRGVGSTFTLTLPYIPTKI